MNFYTAIVVLFVTFIVAFDYIGNGRFQRTAFIRKERVTRHLLHMSKSVVTYLDNYRYKAEADRVYVKGLKIVRVMLFVALSFTVLVGIIVLQTVALLFTIIFKGLIVLAGFRIKLSFVDKIGGLLKEFARIVRLDFVYDIVLAPIGAFLVALLDIDLDFSAVNVTCAGATAPLKLFINVLIMGVVIILVASEYQLFSKISQPGLTNKFIFTVATPSYRRKSRYHQRANQGNDFTKAGVSLNYVWTLIVTLGSLIGERSDILHSLLQFMVALVKVPDFVEDGGYLHKFNESCNVVRHFEDWDKYLALGASVLAWLILFPALYEIANILIPGAIPGMPVVEDERAIGNTFKTRGPLLYIYSALRSVWRYTSIYAVDLWWAEGLRKWVLFISRKAPYDIFLPAPSVSRAREVSVAEMKSEDDRLMNPDLLRSSTSVEEYEMTEEGVSTKLAILLTTPKIGKEWEEGYSESQESKAQAEQRISRGASAVRPVEINKDDELYDETDLFRSVMLRNPVANKIMSILEQPKYPTFRVAWGRDQSDRSSNNFTKVFAKAINDAMAMNRDKAVFFTCKRATQGSYRWSIPPTVQRVSAAHRGAGQCFTFVRIKGSTGTVELCRVFDFSLPYYQPGGPGDMASALNDSTNDSVIVLYSHGFVYPSADAANQKMDDNTPHKKWLEKSLDEESLGTNSDDSDVETEYSSEHSGSMKSPTKQEKKGVYGVCGESMNMEELALAVDHCGGDSDIVAKATAYMLLGIPGSGKNKGYQCFCTIDDRDKMIYCSSRGNDSVAMGSSMVDSDGNASELLLDVQFVILNGNSTKLPLDFEIINSPYFEKKSMSCVNDESYVTAPLHVASAQENRKWLQLIKNELPSYFGLLRVENRQMYDACAKVVLCCLSPRNILARFFLLPIISLITLVLTIVCTGHIITPVGRRVWYMVGWKYLHFCLMCFGIWTEPLVQMMKVHEYVNIYSLILSHPAVKIKDMYQKAGIDWKETGIRGARLPAEEKNRMSFNMRDKEEDDDAAAAAKKKKNGSITEEMVVNPLTATVAKDNGTGHDDILKSSAPSCPPGDDDGTDDEGGEEEEQWQEQGMVGGRGGDVEMTASNNMVSWKRRGSDESSSGSDGSSEDENEGEKTENDGKLAGQEDPSWSGVIKHMKRNTGIARGFEKMRFSAPVPGSTRLDAGNELYLNQVEAAEITSVLSYEQMPLVLLRQELQNEYGKSLLALMSTRAILLQLIPGLSLLSVFTEFTARSPMFVYSKTLDERLAPWIMWDCFTRARFMEKEFNDTVLHIRKHELLTNDHCWLNPEYYADEYKNSIKVPERVRGQINKDNKGGIKRMRRAKLQSDIAHREWRVYALGVSLFISGSRLIDFAVRISQFSLIVLLIWGSQEVHYWIVIATFVLSTPMAIVAAVTVVMAFGQMLAITDDDLSYVQMRVTAICGWVMCQSVETREKNAARIREDEKDRAKKQEVKERQSYNGIMSLDLNPSHEPLYDHALRTAGCYESTFDQNEYMNKSFLLADAELPGTGAADSDDSSDDDDLHDPTAISSEQEGQYDEAENGMMMSRMSQNILSVKDSDYVANPMISGGLGASMNKKNPLKPSDIARAQGRTSYTPRETPPPPKSAPPSRRPTRVNMAYLDDVVKMDLDFLGDPLEDSGNSFTPASVSAAQSSLVGGDMLNKNSWQKQQQKQRQPVRFVSAVPETSQVDTATIRRQSVIRRASIDTRALRRMTEDRNSGNGVDEESL
jgi:hypothetical protein